MIRLPVKRTPSWAAFSLLISFLMLPLLAIVIRQLSIHPLPDQPKVTDAPLANNPIPRLYQIEVEAAQSGWTSELHFQAGNLFDQMGDLPGAIAHWEAVSSPDAALLWRLTDAYTALESWSSAIQTLDRLVERDADDYRAHYQLGLMLAAFDPLDAADHLRIAAQETAYRQSAVGLLAALETEPGDPRLSMRVGAVFADQQNWLYAELAFKQAAIIGYPYPEALAYVGLAREQQGKNGESWIKQAVELGPDVPQVHFVQGLYWRNQHVYEASRDALVRAVSIDPDNPAYYAELGKAYQLLLDYDQAEYWLRVAVAVSQNAPEFQQLLAVFYAEAGYQMPPESLNAARASLPQLPPDPGLMAGMGWALHIMGDTTGGLAEIEAALALAPEHPAALYYKARILADQGELQGAVSIMERVAASNSEYAAEAERQIREWTIGNP